MPRLSTIPPPRHPYSKEDLLRIEIEPGAPPVATEDVPPSLSGVSIIIPAFNEADAIEESLRELLLSLDGLSPKVPFEIIVVDDGSTDGTSEKLAAFDDDRVGFVRKTKNGGYGAAIKTGAQRARYDWLAITDADGTYVPKYFEKLLSLRDEHHMVVGARTTQGAKVPLVRRPAKWVLRRLASILIKQHIPDLNSGQRVMWRPIFARYERLLPDQFSLTTTITLIMLSSGYSVHYEPVEYRRRTGSSKIRPVRDVIGFLTLIIRTVIFFNPLRVFIPLSMAFFFAGIALGATSLYLGQFMDVSTLLLLTTSVHVLAIGVLADAINRRAS